MTSSQHDSSGKIVVDSIHGDIHLRDREIRIIDTASFQRLRRLKQLAMAQMVYPTATLTRFAHCIGALGTMIRIIRAAKENGFGFEPEQEENLRLAALLHDVGHYPYSHLMEKVDWVELTEECVESPACVSRPFDAVKSNYPSHEEVGRLIVTSQPDLLEALGGHDRAKAVTDMFTRSEAADPQLSKLIHSSFDIDRWDYLQRDSYATGVPYGRIDINYLLNNLKVSQDGVIGFREKALASLEHFLLARFFMHRVVYFHKTTYGLEEACRQLLRRLRDREHKRQGVPVGREDIEKIVKSEELSQFTDAFIDNIVLKTATDEDVQTEDNRVIHALALSIQGRRPPVLLKEVPVCEETESQYHAGKTFMQNCKTKLSGLAEQTKIPLGQFLLCQPRIEVVKPPQEKRYGQMASLTGEDIKKKAFKEEGDDIKVFMRGTDQPVSLMDIEHSLIARYAKHSLQLFRLYVVWGGGHEDRVITQLRETVKDWDR